MKMIVSALAFLGFISLAAIGFIGIGSMIAAQTYPWQVVATDAACIILSAFLFLVFMANVKFGGGKTVVVEQKTLNVSELALEKRRIETEAQESKAQIDNKVKEYAKNMESQLQKIKESFPNEVL